MHNKFHKRMLVCYNEWHAEISCSIPSLLVQAGWRPQNELEIGSMVTGHSEATCTFDIISQSSTQTQLLGIRLGELLQGGELLLLEGQLGTGKTTFTQGLAKGMGITDVVSSPTFTLLKEYTGQPRPPAATPGTSAEAPQKPRRRLALYHFDLYRLDDPEEILDLGFEDYFYDSGVCVVEWANKAEPIWTFDQLRIRMNVIDETKRALSFMSTGVRYCNLLQQFQEHAIQLS